MLNERLYKALEVSFGHVIIEKENEPADIISNPYGGNPLAWRIEEGGSSGEEYRVNCPFCHDSKHHLYISYLSYTRPVINGVTMNQGGLLAHCFRRNCLKRNGNWMKLTEMISMGMCAVGDGSCQASVLNIDAEPVQDVLPSTSSDVTVDGVRTWVPGYVPILIRNDIPDDVSDYLLNQRGIDMVTLMKFNVGWGQVTTPRTGSMLCDGSRMVVFPVIMNGRLVGVQARCLDRYMTEGGLRYWIHPGMRKRTVVYNLDWAKELGCGVLCEGVFDVLKVGRPGVCIFGHTPSKTQMMLLPEIGGCMILLPDTDVHDDFSTIDEARKLAAGWNESGTFRLGAHVVILPEKDAGAMCRQDIWTAILSQVPEEVQAHLMEHVIPNL